MGPLGGGGDGLVPDGRTPPCKPGPGALSKGPVWCVSSALGGVLGAVSVHDENLAGPLMSGQAITCPQPCSGRPGHP